MSLNCFKVSDPLILPKVQIFLSIGDHIISLKSVKLFYKYPNISPEMILSATEIFKLHATEGPAGLFFYNQVGLGLGRCQSSPQTCWQSFCGL